MIEGLVFLDVNIPMYAAGGAHPLKDPCVWLMSQVASDQISAAIDTEIIQEVLYRYSALRRFDVAVSMAGSLLDLVPVIFPVRPADARLSVELFGQYVRTGATARDAIHAAVMHQNGLTKIISTDDHFDQFKGLTRLDPQELFARR
jgi:predicted nucleic acid-binding protein